MKIPPAAHGVSVVLVGNLNPVIITPQWLARHEAISVALADAADIKVIHPEVSSFTVGWCTLHIGRDRFVASTNEAPFIRLSDLVAKVFGELLPNTPLRALGINVTVSFSAPSLQARTAFGLKLVPPEQWGEWGKGIAEKIQSSGSKSPHGGMVSVTMQQRPMDDRDDGWLNVKVEPAPRLPDNTGIYVETNDHYVILDAGEPKSDGLAFATLLDKRFEKSIQRSESIVDQLMRLIP